MKSSHITTPRTLADACFIPGADPIERPAQEGMDWQDVVVTVGSVLAVFALLALLFAGVL